MDDLKYFKLNSEADQSQKLNSIGTLIHIFN